MPIARRSLEQTRGNGRLRSLLTILACVGVGLALTTTLTVSTIHREQDAAAAETNARLRTVGDAIDRQVSRYAETLFGLRAAFGHSPGINRTDFRMLVDIGALTRRNPGAESVSFDRYVRDPALPAFQALARRQVPGFTVHPVGHDPGHVVVDFLEPAASSSPAFGLDLSAEPIRRAAMEFARDTGELSATKPLALVQEPIGPGFLLMLAAYDVSPVPVTAPARRRHFLGVLVAVFAANKMIDQALETRPDLAVSIYDAGPTVNTPSDKPGPADWVVGKATPDYVNFDDIDVGSRRWRIVTDSPVQASSAPAIATATSGTALTLLVVGLLTAISLSRARALRLAARMTADLRDNEEQLRAANESIRGFIDIAAHDLRSPLVSIAGFSAILNDDEVHLSPADHHQAITTIERQSQHMGRLIDDMLTMSSIDGGGLITRPEPIVLIDAINDCLQSTAGYTRIVSVACPPEIVVRADPHHLRRILENYLQNALKYGRPPVEIDATVVDTHVEIRVRDQGPGVPRDFAPMLFGKFARANTPETTAQKGTGLGLSIVSGLAEANGGQASYEPNKPRGSSFIVRLPLVQSS